MNSFHQINRAALLRILPKHTVLSFHSLNDWSSCGPLLAGARNVFRYFVLWQAPSRNIFRKITTPLQLQKLWIFWIVSYFSIQKFRFTKNFIPWKWFNLSKSILHWHLQQRSEPIDLDTQWSGILFQIPSYPY